MDNSFLFKYLGLLNNFLCVSISRVGMFKFSGQRGRQSPHSVQLEEKVPGNQCPCPSNML